MPERAPRVFRCRSPSRAPLREHVDVVVAVVGAARWAVRAARERDVVCAEQRCLAGAARDEAEQARAWILGQQDDDAQAVGRGRRTADLQGLPAAFEPRNAEPVVTDRLRLELLVDRQRDLLCGAVERRVGDARAAGILRAGAAAGHGAALANAPAEEVPDPPPCDM